VGTHVCWDLDTEPQLILPTREDIINHTGRIVRLDYGQADVRF